MAALGRRSFGLAALVSIAAVILALRGGVLWQDHSLDSIDGALQTWFALDHFARGEQLGTAFQSYLGITMVLALLPGFVGLGKTLFASTVAAQAAVVVAAFATCLACVWLIRPIPRAKRWQAAMVLAVLFYYAGPMAAGVVGLAWPATLDPGVSLRPLRGALPFLVLPFFVALVRRALRIRGGLVEGAWLGCVAGLGLLWSNDAGFPLVIALSGALVLALHRRIAVLMRMLAGFALGTAASALALLLAVTHGAPGPWVQYNFRDVAGDQFWFFAPWERTTRILGPADLPNILRHADPLSAASLTVLTICVLWAMLRRLRDRGDPVRGSGFVFVGASVLGTALIPQIGGHVGAEYNGITFVLGVCAPLIVWGRGVLRLVHPLVRRVASPVAVGALTALAGLAMVGIEAQRFASIRANTDRTVLDQALGFHVTPAYAADLAAMRALAAGWDARGIPADRRLLSVYTSPLDIAAGARSPAPVGSLIHALGPANRADFIALVAARKVAAVTTIAPDYSGWEGWITRANAPFFEALRQNYIPIARNNQQVVWVLAETLALPAAAASCRVEAVSRSSLTLTTAVPIPGLAAVSVRRTGPFATGRSAMLTVVETSPDTATPGQERWTDFPRYAVANTARLDLIAPAIPETPTRLMLEVLDGSAIGTATCTAAALQPVDFAALPSLPQGITRYLAGGAP